MTDPDPRREAIRLYDAFTHEHHDRRRFMRAMIALTGTAAAAEALVAGIAASPAAAALIDPADKRLNMHRSSVLGQKLRGYYAVPRKRARKIGAVMVCHENRGLNAHIEDVARRLALEGFWVVAPDFLSDQGGTPADENVARDKIAKVDYDSIIAEAVALIDRLRKLKATTGKVGVIGFCWGGGLVDRIAVAAGGALSAGVSYYGPAPDPAEASRVQAAMLLHYAGNDARVAATGTPWTEALRAAGKEVQAFTYPGVEHAFNNDTSAERYNEAAAKLAWSRTVAFLHARLDA